MTPEQLQAWRWEKEIDERNRPLSDDELDTLFPEGYKVGSIYISCYSPEQNQILIKHNILICNIIL